MIARMDPAPLTAALVALLWLVGALTGSFLLLGIAAVSGLILPACWSIQRRTPPRRRILAVGLGGTAVAAAALLLALYLGQPPGPWTLELEILALGAGSLAVPLFYAATFGNGRGNRS